MDYAYKEAVKSGDLKTAQLLVNQAAVAMGYNSDYQYRGNKRRFTQYETGLHEKYVKDVEKAGLAYIGNFKKGIAFSERLGDAVWFTDCEDTAYGYMDGAEDGEVHRVFLRYENPLDLRPDVVGKEKVETILSEIYEDDIKVGNQYGEDLDTARAIVWDNSKMAAYARSNGFDAVIHPDTDVTGRYCHVSTMVFRPEQIKSAEAVCTDDAGRLIPLSDRFDPESPDIRGKLPEPELEVAFD